MRPQLTNQIEPVKAGSHQHYFLDSNTNPLVLGAGDVIVTYVLLSPCNPPREIMLEFQDQQTNASDRRAYWGENLIIRGTDGTNSRRFMGPLPQTGGWVRLEIPSEQLGMSGRAINGMSFWLYDGQAWWDRTGKAPGTGGQDVLRPASETETDPRIESAPAVEPPAEPSAQSATRSESAVLVNTGNPRFGRVRGWVSRNVAQRARRLFRRRPPNEPTAQPPVSMAMAAQIVETASASSRRYSFYTPELNLMAESEYTDGASPAIAHEYIWFAGQPVAQIDSATSTTHWTFTDHLGTPILQTDSNANVTWRAEHEPYGQIYQLRTGENRHQPLRFPGQEAEQLSLGINGYTERSYNIFRWYRAGWGKYSQADPLLGQDPNANDVFGYTKQNPIAFIDPLGLLAEAICSEIALNGVNTPFYHCRVRVTCKECTGGNFGGPFDTTVGLERNRKTGELHIDEQKSYEGKHFDLGISEADSCNFGKCVRAYAEYFKQLAKDWTPQWTPIGPNSNSFAGHLARTCGATKQPYWAPGWNGPFFKY